MDKYEYKLKTEQMLELMEDGAYRKAADIADTIEWRRVRNASMLVQVSDIYEKNREFQKSYDVLNIAYHRAEGSRKIISRLCTLALKTGNVDEAIDYYDDFVQIAPKDPNQYILRYQILREQRAPVEQQIEALEEFKKSEYIEEWAYELAKLYQEAGMTAECLEECDDLILWFSEGKYVYKAMELKMQYKPLTPSQQEKYDHRFEKTSAETEEMPDLLTYAEAKEAQEKGEDDGQSEKTEEEIPVEGLPEAEDDETEEVLPEDTEEESQVADVAAETEETEGKPVEKKKQLGDVMPLDEALKQLLHPEKSGAGKDQEEEEPDISDLEEAIEEIEAVADLEMADKAVQKVKKNKPASVSGKMTEIVPEDDEEETEDKDESLENTENETVVIEEEKVSDGEEKVLADDDQIKGQMSFEDILAGWEQQVQASAAETAEEEIQPDQDIEALIEEAEELITMPEDADLSVDEAEELSGEDGEILEDEAEELPEEDSEIPEDEAEEFLEEESKIPEGGEIEEEETMDIEEKKKPEPILPPDIQRLIDEIEGVAPVEEPKVKKEKKPEEPHENMGKVTEELRIDDLDEFLDEEEYFDDDEITDDAEEYFDAEDEEAADEEEYFEGPDLLDEDEEYFEDEEEIVEEDEEEDAENSRPDIEEEFRVDPKHSDEPDDREIPDEDDGMDILSATTPLSRKETAKLIATGKTAPLPLTEISDALSMSDTGFIVHGRYDLEMQSEIGTRAGLTEEQKKLFSYFVPVRGMSEQLVDVLEQDKNCTNRGGTSKTGNLLIIGNKGNGKTVLAVDVVKAIQKQRNIRQGKVAIVTGDSLNKKKIGDIFSKLYGGALIIEKAGRMDEKTVARLNKAMEKDTGELLIVLEEQRKPLDRLLSSNREFRRKFTSRLEVPIFINDELVTFGQTYAQENGYRIDEMGILALYSQIDSLQREDHAVTVAEVKEIMDKAIAHSQKASAKKLVRRVFGKNTDDADRILLSEKDFNV